MVQYLTQTVYLTLLSIGIGCLLRTSWHTASTTLSYSFAACNKSKGYTASKEAWRRLKRALQIRTVADMPFYDNREELKNMRNFLIDVYWDVFESPFVRYEVVNDYSLLISVDGSDHNSTPYLLTAHIDVAGGEREVDPSSGADEETTLRGSGSAGCKTAVIGLLEALRIRMSHGFQPRKSFYIAFGHDAVVGGVNGAQEIAALLRKRGVQHLEFIVSEGGAGYRNLIPGVKKDILTIGVTEKGYVALNLSVKMDESHLSKIPPYESTIGIISNAVSKLEAMPHDVVMDDVLAASLRSASLHMKFPLSVMCSNLWLFRPAVARVLAKGVTQPLVRTSTAFTMIRGGSAENVMPSHAWAVVSHRIHPSQTIDEVIAADRAVMNDDRVTITTGRASESHPVSPHDIEFDAPYRLVRKSLRQVFSDSALILPSTTVSPTDTVHYLSFTEHVFRLLPFILNKTQAFSYGRNERITRNNFESAIDFYYHVMLNADLEDFNLPNVGPMPIHCCA